MSTIVDFCRLPIVFLTANLLEPGFPVGLGNDGLRVGVVVTTVFPTTSRYGYPMGKTDSTVVSVEVIVPRIFVVYEDTTCEFGAVYIRHGSEDFVLEEA
jgi:hypothetical protein